MLFRKKTEYKEDKYKKDFVIFSKYKNLIYFDSACVTLKPKVVVDKINEYYNEYPGCGGRSGHFIGERVTNEVDDSREIIAKYLNTKYSKEIIFTRNTTEGINLVSNSLNFNKEDFVVISDKEHNSNFLPWVNLEKKNIIKLKILKTKNGKIDLKELEDFVKNNKVKLISLNYSSNLDGIVNPVKDIIDIAHKNNSLVLLDGAQSMGHIKIDVQKLDVDFLCFSGHKIYGPSGIGVLYGKEDLLKELKTYNIGGDTVGDVNYPNYNLLDLPNKFEAGLQDYSGIISLGEAIKYLDKNLNIIEERSKKNLDLLFELTTNLPIYILSNKENNNGIFTFIPKNVDSRELGVMLNEYNICVRTGNFCVHNWFNKNNKKYALRVSLGIYNNEEDVKKFVDVLKKLI